MANQGAAMLHGDGLKTPETEVRRLDPTAPNGNKLVESRSETRRAEASVSAGCVSGPNSERRL